MKSMFVVSDNRVYAHGGEEYDLIQEVIDEPTTENIQPYANSIMNGIRTLWRQDEGSPDRRVVVALDAASPFAAVLENLQIIMKAQSGIEIDLPWNRKPDVNALDEESKDMLKKLDERK